MKQTIKGEKKRALSPSTLAQNPKRKRRKSRKHTTSTPPKKTSKKETMTKARQKTPEYRTKILTNNPLGLCKPLTHPSNSKASQLNPSDFELNRAHYIFIGNCYTINRAKNVKTGINRTAKIFDKHLIQKQGIKSQIEQEIALYWTLRKSRTVLNLIGMWNTSHELVLIFESFGAPFRSTKAITRQEKFHILSQVLTGLLEIDSYDFSVVGFTKSSVVSISGNDVKLFDFQYLTKLGTKCTNTVGLEEAFPPPEVQNSALTAKSNTWAFGALFLNLMIGRDNFARIDPKLLYMCGRSYLSSFLDNFRAVRFYRDLILSMLDTDVKGRVEVFSLFNEDPFYTKYISEVDLKLEMPKQLRRCIDSAVRRLRQKRESNSLGMSVMEFSVASRPSRKASDGKSDILEDPAKFGNLSDLKLGRKRFKSMHPPTPIFGNGNGIALHFSQKLDQLSVSDARSGLGKYGRSSLREKRQKGLGFGSEKPSGSLGGKGKLREPKSAKFPPNARKRRKTKNKTFIIGDLKKLLASDSSDDPKSGKKKKKKKKKKNGQNDNIFKNRPKTSAYDAIRRGKSASYSNRNRMRLDSDCLSIEPKIKVYTVENKSRVGTARDLNISPSMHNLSHSTRTVKKGLYQMRSYREDDTLKCHTFENLPNEGVYSDVMDLEDYEEMHADPQKGLVKYLLEYFGCCNN